ncbi:hypothetical protein TM902_180062 [Tenacibaculum maritimum]|uniref:hypothetical protein n=1 Tax=Tenacibaculum maritimum TaxID=107401 RepID=UPI0012E58B38|nr:hypothetical protein [Tenacibaculum maritimum]MCD9582304.1 hypothetical protein [Tenacibaculum maritimum]MCD9636686.1 hypothetical protein [Tenacibaculum maritimum]CAA0144793.1 hypothetical protein TM902_180062 [Tenacibaculum maritimum]CAA0192850.1 hypothetical protein USCSE301_250022 [Tenacibaculum maritimum]
MLIQLRLREVLERCSDWREFCKNEGYSEWCISEGAGAMVITLSEEKAIEYGIINK